MANTDPYTLHESAIREPPTSIWGSLPYLGPGFILSASIVGSGELIATTIVGAKAGFVLMWFLIFSCLVKVAVQIEFGKHAISSGESTMASLNTLPGPRLGRANWSIWTWLLLMIAKMMQVGGIVGGVVLAIEQFAPSWAQMPMRAITTYVVAASVSLLVFRGYYLLIEKTSLIMIGAFTLFTLASLFALQTTELAITGGELATGLIPSIPDRNGHSLRRHRCIRNHGCRWRRDHGLQLLALGKGLRRLHGAEKRLGRTGNAAPRDGFASCTWMRRWRWLPTPR